MRSLWRSLCSVFLAFCIVFSNSLCALANTTTEQVYSVMPLDYPSSNFSISLYTGKYNMYDESFDMGSRVNTGVVNGSTLYDYYGIWYDYDNFKPGDMISLGFSIGSSDNSSPISIPDGSFLSIYLNNLILQVIHDDSYYHLDTFSAVPYKVYADMHFTATQQIGNTHSGTYHNQTIDITNFLRPSSNPLVEGQNFDLDLNIPIVADTSGFTGDRLYNINLRYIKIYAVYDFSQVSNNFINNLSVGDSFQLAFFVRNFGSDNLKTSRFSINYTPSSSSDSSTVNANIIQSSIATMSSNVSTQISQVKTQITQSTNTITTKIDTMSQDIQTGLQNVVTSAQQNTQNIINTVTTKVDEVKTGITEVKDSIIDLPNKLQDMLVGFFVPDEETINSKFAEFETLLSDRFGLIYQSADIIHDFADSLQTQAVMVADTGGVITLPSVTVNLVGTDFTFGGYDVDIIPDGFEALQTAVRLATSMVCTVVFVNMLKNKLEAILK